ncbi:hypothetical protein [Paracoccus sp. IB05]|uniref:hypothetical protein n=1 Tax=Paracoccus sp. IB05 TaxID=2779367 RepID=UPI0018E817CF|nr:hypothetical protein [Paracoccus sp. IB05]MBJ2150665.1 hypothetical protein [Paracoccus sp. IB05]
MSDRYFDAAPTALTIPKRGALAIYAGEKSRKLADGCVSMGLRGPLLIMPPEMWTDGEKLMEDIAQMLNENAGRFFDSAKDKQAEHDRRVLAGEI